VAVALVLSVVVRWEPTLTVVNGTLVARLGEDDLGAWWCLLLPNEKAGCWTRRRAFAQVRQASNIQLLPYPLVALRQGSGGCCSQTTFWDSSAGLGCEAAT
jgi:hypothetical protein